MIQESILGKLYSCWSYSRIFAALAAVAHVFGRAWHSSLARRFVCGRARLRSWYVESLAARILDRICAGILKAFGIVAKAAGPAAAGSKIVRLAGNSRIAHPDTLFCVFVCVMFCIPHQFWKNQYALAVFAMLFAVFAVKAAAGKEKVLLPSALGLPFLLFVLSCIASLLFSADLRDSIRVLGFFACAFIIMWSAAAVFRDRKRLALLLRFIYAAVLITSLLAIAQRISGIEPSATQTDLMINSGVPGRVYSTLDNPNNYAEFLVLFTPLCAVLAANAKTAGRRLLLALGLILPVAALIMTYSRSGWISAALTVVLFAYFTDRRLVPWLLVLALVAIPFLPSGVLIRLSNLFNTSDSSADYRLRIWQTIARLLSDQNRWLTGIGPGPGSLAAQIGLFADDYVLAGIVHSQMLYMELVLEFGLSGFVFFIWMMASEVCSGARALWVSNDRFVRGVLAACVSSFAGMALFSVFEYIWFYPRILFGFFLLLGILRASRALSEEGLEHV